MQYRIQFLMKEKMCRDLHVVSYITKDELPEELPRWDEGESYEDSGGLSGEEVSFARSLAHC